MKRDTVPNLISPPASREYSLTGNTPRGLWRSSTVIGMLTSIALLVAGVVTDPTAGALMLALWVCAVAVGGITLCGIREPLERASLPYVGNVALIVMFGLHPLAMVLTGVRDEPFHYLYDLRPTYDMAVGLGLAATVAFNLGVTLRLPRQHSPHHRGNQLRPQYEDEARDARRLGFVLSTLAFLGYAAFAATSGQGVVDAILGGARRGAETSSTAYLYLAPLLLGPATLLFLYSALQRKKKPVGALILIAIQVALFLPGGQRIVLILSVLPSLMAFFSLRRRRLSTAVYAGVMVLAFLGMVSLRDLGTPNGPTVAESFEETLSDPGAAMLETLTGDDSEMIDSIAVLTQIVPSHIDHQPFRSILALFSSPIPSNIWEGKIQPMDSTVNATLLRTSVNSAGLAYSLAGEFYFDGGFAAVIGGFFLLGLGSARLTEWYRSANTALAIVIYLSLTAALVNLVRGSLTYTSARLLFSVGPLLLFALYVARRRKAEKSGRQVSA